MENKADLLEPIVASRIGFPPVVVRAIVTKSQAYMAGGMPQADVSVENYILLSAMPKELQDRIRTAVGAIISGM